MRFSLTYRRGIVRNYRNVHPETRYARSGDVSIAYQVVGEGPFDLVFVPPFGVPPVP